MRLVAVLVYPISVDLVQLYVEYLVTSEFACHQRHSLCVAHFDELGCSSQFALFNMVLTRDKMDFLRSHFYYLI